MGYPLPYQYMGYPLPYLISIYRLSLTWSVLQAIPYLVNNKEIPHLDVGAWHFDESVSRQFAVHLRIGFFVTSISPPVVQRFTTHRHEQYKALESKQSVEKYR